MKALVLDAPGDASRFDLKDLADPVLKPGHLLVRIHASSVNPIDCKLRRRGTDLLPPAPIVLGADFAGVVAAVAGDVNEFQPGDRVFGCAGGVAGTEGGTLAELLLVDARLVAPMPRTLDFRAAAALPLVALTAWEGLHRAGIAAGRSVLVLGGTGGVGHVAVQMARSLGATVTATVSTPDKAALARRLGAGTVVLHDAGEALLRAAAGTDGFDVVFDASGQGDLASALAVLRPGGHVVLIAGRQAPALVDAFGKGASVHFVFIVIPLHLGVHRARHGAMLREISALVDRGGLSPLVDPRRFTLAEADAAYRVVEEGQATGKVVIDLV